VKSLVLFVVFLFSSAPAFAGKVTYDLVRYTAPAPWKKVAWTKDLKKDANSTSYTVTDKSNGTYCQIFILRSNPTKGDVNADFASDWKTVMITNYGVTEPAQVTETAVEGDWQAKAGVATFAFDKGTSIAMLTTITGLGKTVSIVAVTSSADYLPAIQALLGSVEMLKPAAGDASSPTPAAKSPSKSKSKDTAQPTALQGYMEYSPFTKTWTWKLRYPPPAKK